MRNVEIKLIKLAAKAAAATKARQNRRAIIFRMCSD